MSIYATLWELKFSRFGNDHTDCEWVDVIAQGVPAHIGSPAPGYDGGDPYAGFLPPAVEVEPNDDGTALRAVAFVTASTAKGTSRSAQEYVHPLLVLSGRAYEGLSFGQVHRRICDALRGNRPRIVLEEWSADGRVRMVFEDGRLEEIRRNVDS